jgi:hypothetical protein
VNRHLGIAPTDDPESEYNRMTNLIVTGIETTAAALAIASLTGALLLRPLIRGGREAAQTLGDLRGRDARPGVPRQAGVLEQLQVIKEQASANEREARLTREEMQDALVQTERRMAGALVQVERRTSASLADQDQVLAKLTKNVGLVVGELTPNGGGSSKDQLTRIDNTMHPDTAQSVREDHSD